MNRLSKIILTLTLAFGGSAFAQTYSPWLPQPQQLVVSPTYSFSTFDKFWLGEEKVSIKPEELDQHTAILGLEYGVNNWIALDVSAGYTHTVSDAFGGENEDNGLADTNFGIRFALAHDSSYIPALAVRVGGIIAGTYDENFPFSAGDGASGAEASLLFGKSFGWPGFALYGDVGYRIRNHDVPNEVFGSVGISQTISSFTVSFGYRYVNSLSGDDIGDPGFTFPETRESSQNLEASIGYTDAGGRYYQVFGALTVDGRNTGEKKIIGASMSIPFGGGAEVTRVADTGYQKSSK